MFGLLGAGLGVGFTTAYFKGGLIAAAAAANAATVS